MNPRTSPQLALAVLSFIAGTLLFTSCSTTHVAGPHEVSYAHYNESLQDQVADHIGDRVTARLGANWHDHDRYFIIPFAYENDGNDPEYSHSFMSVIRVFADGKKAKVTPGLRMRTYKNWEFEAFTISWLPADFPENPHLCVFEGFGARLIPSLNQCPISPGKSFDLPTTLKLAVHAKVAVGMWGPYEIAPQAFETGVKRLRLLDEGKIKYRADDRLYRRKLVAINCFHAMANLYNLFPAGGLFNTGLDMWGLNGTRRVLLEYTTVAHNRGMLLEPVDIEKDLFGFVYAPDRSGNGVYNPFHTAYAYHK